MEETESTICRLCLEIIQPNCLNITSLEPCSQKLSFLLPDKVTPLAINHSICSKCTKELQESYDFKMACLESEQNVRIYINSRDASTVELQKVLFNLTDESGRNQTICRLCCTLGIDSFTKLDVFNDETLGQMVLQCLPEVDVATIRDPLICQSCLENLRRQHSFVQKCLRVEEKIADYLTHLGISVEDLDSEKMLQFLAQNRSTPSEALCIKTETEAETDNTIENHMEVSTAEDPPQTNPVTSLAGSTIINGPARIYSCKKCSYTTLSDAELKYHFVEEHTNNGKNSLYECDTCSFVTRHWNVWSNHKVTHLSEDQIVWMDCPNCTYRSKLKGNLEKHMLTHNASGEKRFKCEECPYRSMWKRDLDRHLLKHKQPDQITMHGCHLCSFSTKHQRYLKLHVTKVHVGEEKTDEVYRCAQCNFTTKQKRSLAPHMLTHRHPDDLVSYRCQYCKYEAKWKKSVRMHEETHLKKYNCDQCEFVTNQKRFLKEHVRGHEPLEQPTIHTCDECGFKTIYKHSFVKHGLVHKQPDELIMHCCQHCEYKSKRRQDLRQHVYAMHTDDATVYECDVCTYKTKYKGGLRTHINLQHKSPDEVTKFRCGLCPFETKYKSSLISHEESFHKEFDEASLLKCPLCPYKTKRRECLQKHSIIHDTDCQMFQCHQCGFESKYKRALLRHIMGHEPKKRTKMSTKPESKPEKKPSTKPKKKPSTEPKKKPSTKPAKPFTCGKCNYSTKRSADLKSHEEMHFEEVKIEAIELCVKDEVVT